MGMNRTGGISIKNSLLNSQRQNSQARQRTMTVALTPQTIADYWSKLIEVIGPKIPRLKDNLLQAQIELQGDLIMIHTLIGYLEVELRPFMVEMLEWLRHESGHNDLQMRIVVETPEVEERPYTAADKFELLLKENPAMAELKRLLGNVDI